MRPSSSFIVPLLAIAAVGCAGPPPPNDDDDVDRGPTVVILDADVNGLWWDDAEQALYLADDDGNRVLRRDVAGALSTFATLPPASDRGPGLGQLARTAEGRFVVPRFGGGTAGDVVVVEPDGTSRLLPGLDTVRRRIGVTVASDGHIYGAGFVVSGDDKLGSVALIDLDAGTETPVLEGLQKPVGVLAVGSDLYVADQDRREVLRAPLADPSAAAVIAEPDSADLLSAGPDGSLFTGGRTGAVFHISALGAVTTFHSGLQEVRGTAYDRTNRRLFVVDHDGTEDDGVEHKLHILPVD